MILKPTYNQIKEEKAKIFKQYCLTKNELSLLEEKIKQNSKL